MVAPDSWNLGRLIEVEDIVTHRGGPKKKLWFKILVGPWSGDEVSMISSTKAMFYMGVQTGFSKYTVTAKQHHADEIVGFVMVVYVKNPGRPEWDPAVIAYGVSSSLEAHNRKLAKGRRAGVCPHRVTPMKCSDCVRGLDTCKFAVRAYTWVQKKCVKCHEVKWHNPRDPEICFACNRARLRQLFKDYKHGK
jgi:hypothetical protein